MEGEKTISGGISTMCSEEIEFFDFECLPNKVKKGRKRDTADGISMISIVRKFMERIK